MAEIQQYKQKRIRQLQSVYTQSLKALNTVLSAQLNRARSMPPRARSSYVNQLMAAFQKNVASLKAELQRQVTLVQQTTFVSHVPASRTQKRALLVGLNYIGTSSELFGCINDARSLEAYLLDHGFPAENISVLTDLTEEKPSKSVLLQSFRTFLLSAQPEDLLFFAFSGHGSYVRDKEGEEFTGMDQVIIPLDMDPIVDDELKQMLVTCLKSGTTLVGLFDSCFSGTVLDLKYQFLDSLASNQFRENEHALETQGNVFMISGCSDRQYSADSVFNDRANGAMTWAFLESLNQRTNKPNNTNNTNKSLTWRQLVQQMRTLLKTNGYDQIPQFSTGQMENIDLPAFI